MTSAAPSETGNARGRRARSAVLAAATQLFAARGYAGTSIADIASAAGVAKPSVLYHFADKDTVWREAVDTLWAEVDAFYAARWPRHLKPGRALTAAVLRLFIEAGLTWPAYIRIPFIEGAAPSWRSQWLVERHFAGHVGTTSHILSACQAKGLLPPGDIFLYQALMTSSINVFLAQAAMWSAVSGHPVNDPRFLDAYVELVLSLTFRSEKLDKPDLPA